MSAAHLGVDSNDLATLVAVVGEHILIALDAVGEVLPQDIPGVMMRVGHCMLLMEVALMVPVDHCDDFVRFSLTQPSSRIKEAVSRIQKVVSDMKNT